MIAVGTGTSGAAFAVIHRREGFDELAATPASRDALELRRLG
jgi:hypothetical protein